MSPHPTAASEHVMDDLPRSRSAGRADSHGADAVVETSEVNARALLLGGAAHELNNIFSQTLLLAEVLSTTDLDDELRGMLSSLQGRVKRGIGVVNRLYEQSLAAGEMMRFDARHLVASVHKQSRQAVGTDVRVSHRYPDDLPEIHTEPQLLLETLMDVCQKTAAEQLAAGQPCAFEVIADIDPVSGSEAVWVGATAPASLRSDGLIDSQNVLNVEPGKSEFLDRFCAHAEQLGAIPGVRPASGDCTLGMAFHPRH